MQFGIEQRVVDSFDAEAVFVSEQDAAESGGQKKKRKGRLGRLTYEFKCGDVFNRNRRIYPSGVVKEAVDEMQGRLKKRRVLGTLDHPEGWDMGITIKDAAVKVESVSYAADGRMTVVLDVLDNDDGRRLVTIIEAEGNPGVSQRAMAVWREPNADDRAKYGIPDDQYFVVAEHLRLISFDVVGEPGFDDADEPSFESKKGPDMSMTIEKLKAEHPALVAAIAAEARASAVSGMSSTVADEVAKQKPQIVAEAVKPLNEQIATLNAELASHKKALEAVKPILVKLGVVNEQITDREAAAQIGTLSAENATLKATVQATEAKLAEAQKQVDEFNTIRKAAAALQAVERQYANDPYKEEILKQVGSMRLADESMALAAAKSVSDFIVRIKGTAPAPTLAPGNMTFPMPNPGGAPGNEGVNEHLRHLVVNGF